VTASHLECPFRETDPQIRDLIYTAINHVLEVDGSKAPQDKLTCIVECAKTIFSILGKGGNEHASADDFLPSLIYILMKANPPRVTSNINFITRFTNEHRLRSGEEGYYFTNLCCAISFIENLSAQSLSLPEEEFKLYMSGESIPPGSWETSLLMCEGIQTMSHNLKTLSELTELQERILSDAEALEAEMRGWEETIKAEVEAVLARTQYTIRGPKQPAVVDSVVDACLSLPPPLLPQPTAHSPQPLGAEPQPLNLPQPLPPLGDETNPVFLQAGGRSLIDQTPTEDLLSSPLLPGIPPLSTKSSGEINGAMSSGGGASGANSSSGENGSSSSDETATSGTAARELTLSGYVGFSAQSFSIPSISCITAETQAQPVPQQQQVYADTVHQANQPKASSPTPSNASLAPQDPSPLDPSSSPLDPCPSPLDPYPSPLDPSPSPLDPSSTPSTSSPTSFTPPSTDSPSFASPDP